MRPTQSELATSNELMMSQGVLWFSSSNVQFCLTQQSVDRCFVKISPTLTWKGCHNHLRPPLIDLMQVLTWCVRTTFSLSPIGCKRSTCPKNSRVVHTHTHGYTENTHTLCQHERVTTRTTCGLRRPLSDQSLRRRRPVSNSTQEIFWFHVDTWVSDKKINHVPKKQEQNNVEWGYFFFCGQRVSRRQIVYL